MVWIPIVLAVGVVVVWFYTTWSGYGAIFDEKHLAEFAGKVRGAKAAALAKVRKGVDQDVAADGRGFLSSVGISFLYTVETAEGGEFFHHYSISRPEGILSGSLGEQFTVYVAKVIGAPLERLMVVAKPPRFFHCEFRLSGEEQERFAGEGVQGELSAQEAKGLYVESLHLRDGVFGRL